MCLINISRCLTSLNETNILLPLVAVQSPTHLNTEDMQRKRCLLLECVFLYLKHFKAFAPPLIIITGGSLASSCNALSLDRPFVSTDLCLWPTASGDGAPLPPPLLPALPPLSSVLLRLGVASLGLDSPCSRRRRRCTLSLSGVSVVELGCGGETLAALSRGGDRSTRCCSLEVDAFSGEVCPVVADVDISVDEE